MKRTLISSGSTFESQIGYSRAVVAGDWVFVSGTTGFDYATMTISDDVVVQAEQCLKNIASALAQNSPTGEIPEESTTRKKIAPIWRALRGHDLEGGRVARGVRRRAAGD